MCGALAAFALRLALVDTLPDGFPYLTFFPAVILTTFFCGVGPGVVSAALCGAMAWYFFMPATGYQSALAIGFYAIIVAVDITLIHLMHEAARHLRQERAVSERLYQNERVLFQELQHRVANNIQFISGLLMMQKRQAAADPSRAAAILSEAQTRLETISRVHRMLHDPSRMNLEIGPYLQTICNDVLQSSGARDVACVVDFAPAELDLTRLTALSLLVVELVTNAVKHAFGPEQAGTIMVSLRPLDAARYGLTISDNGKGLSPGVEPGKVDSLGLRICEGLAAQMHGKLTTSSGSGTTVQLEFPKVMPA
ncbi:putative two-component sensor histidine kinase with a histidine kinase (N-term) and an ATP-binding region (C-ter) [Bradyrhizobium sp. ORS 278]|nr:putative two-component sensor histidine kinase with a histidine kinase (N-term) and an ATP-binding region (C-ter) [Bradyrhizobium sp. ORS 278]